MAVRFCQDPALTKRGHSPIRTITLVLLMHLIAGTVSLSVTNRNMTPPDMPHSRPTNILLPYLFFLDYYEANKKIATPIAETTTISSLHSIKMLTKKPGFSRGILIRETAHRSKATAKTKNQAKKTPQKQHPSQPYSVKRIPNVIGRNKHHHRHQSTRVALITKSSKPKFFIRSKIAHYEQDTKAPPTTIDSTSPAVIWDTHRHAPPNWRAVPTPANEKNHIHAQTISSPFARTGSSQPTTTPANHIHIANHRLPPDHGISASINTEKMVINSEVRRAPLVTSEEKTTRDAYNALPKQLLMTKTHWTVNVAEQHRSPNDTVLNKKIKDIDTRLPAPLPSTPLPLANKSKLAYNLLRENIIYPVGVGKNLLFHCPTQHGVCYRIDEKTGLAIYYTCIDYVYCREIKPEEWLAEL